MSRKQNKSKEFFESRDKFEREVKRPKTRSAYIPQLVKKLITSESGTKYYSMKRIYTDETF